MLLAWTVTALNCYFTEVFACYFMNCNLTELLLDWTVSLLSYLHVTLLDCYLAELLLYWAVCMLLCWTVTWLNCYFTELFACNLIALLLEWTSTWLNCHFTERLHVTLQNCYLTLLNCTSTWLNCYFSELDWTVTLLDSSHVYISVTRKFLN